MAENPAPTNNAPAEKPEQKKQMTPGQRLAAEKAAKAARKASQRGKQTEVVQKQLAQRAHAASDWIAKNRSTLWIAAGGVVVLLAVAVGWSLYVNAQSREAAALLRDATQTATASIAEQPAEEDALSFKTLKARETKAVRRFEALVDAYPSSEAAMWAWIGKGNASLRLGKPKEARAAFGEALSRGEEEGHTTVQARALEGIGFTHEATEEWAKAVQRFKQLRSFEDETYEAVSDYQVARVLALQGKTNEAVELLKEVTDQINEQSLEQEPTLTYTKEQAEQLLTRLDPSAAPAMPAGRELEIQQMIRQMQMQQQAGGGMGQ